VGEARAWFRQHGLTRPRRGRWIAGVCAGLARRYGVPVVLVRILVVLSLFLPGPQVLAYVALWILMPRDRI
jgi:phage shock protein C